MLFLMWLGSLDRSHDALQIIVDLCQALDPCFAKFQESEVA